MRFCSIISVSFCTCGCSKMNQLKGRAASLPEAISSWTTFLRYDSWDDLAKASNVPGDLSTVASSQNALDKFILTRWLHFPTKVLVVPEVLDRIEVWTFCCSSPPVQAFLKELYCMSGSMFRMHEAISTRIDFTHEGQQCLP